MKILQIIPNLSSGGGERFTVDLSNELVAQGHEVILVTLFDCSSNEKWGFYSHEVHAKIKQIHLDKKLGFDISLFSKLKKLIETIQPDVVHSHLSVIKYIGYAAICCNTLFFHTLHSDASKLIHSKPEYYISKFLYKKYIQAVCISEESLKSYEQIYSLFNGELIYNGRKKMISTDKNDLIEKELSTSLQKIVTIGRHSLEKNHLNLIKAVNQINKDKPKIQLTILGEGDKEHTEKLQNEIQDLNIQLAGVQTNVADYLLCADAFILPSIYEGMPISLIEAFSVGCIPIASKVGGIKNMINDGENGLFIENSEVEAIVESLERFLTLSDSTKERIRQKAIQSYQEKYSIEQCANAYSSLFASQLLLSK